MTTEQLAIGKELAGQINKLETQLAGWKSAVKFRNEEITVRSIDGYEICVKLKFVDIEIVKAISIASIEKELKELKEQFKNI